MLSNLRIRNFRGITDLALNDVTRFSLIAGENSVGKSSVLEALFLLLDYQSPDVFLKLNAFRGGKGIYSAHDIWGYLMPVGSAGPVIIGAEVHGFEAELVLEKDVNAVTYQSGSLSLPKVAPVSKLNFIFRHGDWEERGSFIALPNELRREVSEIRGIPNLPAQPTFYVPALRGGRQYLATQLGEVELRGHNVELSEALSAFDRRISAIVPITRADETTELYVRFKDNTLLPLSIAGDGLANICMFAIYILSAPGSIVLIDEIENGIHYSKYGALWNAITAAAQRNGTQIFAVTHSYEFVAATVEASKRDSALLPGLFRLEQDQTSSYVAHYRPELLPAAISHDAEVR